MIPQGNLDQQGDLEKEILSLIFEEQRSDSLNANLSRATRAVAQVRDRLSTDLLRIVSQMGSLARASDRVAWGYVSPADALAVLNSCILTLAALRGIEAGNITRGPGWHFLNIGRRIERSLQVVELLRSIVVPIDPENWPSLEMLLEVADSSITYRSRYFTVLQAAPVVDLLMNDEANPRSLAFQLKDLARHCGGAFQHAIRSGLAGFEAEADGGGCGQAAQCGCRIALRGANGEQPHPPGWPARRPGGGLARIRRSHCQHLFQPRGNGACHVIYRVRHQTIYDYVQPVSVSHHVVRLTPRDLRGQRRRTSGIIRLACSRLFTPPPIPITSATPSPRLRCPSRTPG